MLGTKPSREPILWFVNQNKLALDVLELCVTYNISI